VAERIAGMTPEAFDEWMAVTSDDRFVRGSAAIRNADESDGKRRRQMQALYVDVAGALGYEVARGV